MKMGSSIRKIQIKGKRKLKDRRGNQLLYRVRVLLIADLHRHQLVVNPPGVNGLLDVVFQHLVLDNSL